ncbi:MAG: hypothetical protein KBD78_08090 [Oligoflexales bacterium]|nr:hypothetical protein [Oligoflexales bacterium]
MNRYKRIFIFLSGALAFNLASQLTGSENSLPRGQLPPTKVDIGKSRNINLEVPRQFNPCFQELINYPGRQIIFSPQGKVSYHLFQGIRGYVSKPLKQNLPVKNNVDDKLPEAKLEKKEASIVNLAKSNSSAVSIEEVKHHASSLALFDHKKRTISLLKSGAWPKADALIVDPIKTQGIVLVGFVPGKSACMSGDSRLYQISLNSNNKLLQQKSGRYSLVESLDSQYLLFDLNVRQLVTIEPNSFQIRKVLFPLEMGLNPIFAFTKNQGGIYLWKSKDKSSPKGLGFMNTPQIIAKKIAFLESDMLLQQGRFFAAVKTNAQQNSFEIQEIKEWSGRKTQNNFRIVLPPEISSSEAIMRANFATRSVVVLGQSEYTRQKWRKVYVYNYDKSENPTAIISPEKSQYISEVDFVPNSNNVIANVNHMSLDFSSYIIFYDAKKNKSQPYMLQKTEAIDTDK